MYTLFNLNFYLKNNKKKQHRIINNLVIQKYLHIYFHASAKKICKYLWLTQYKKEYSMTKEL